MGGQEGRRRRAQTLRTRFLGLDSLLSHPLRTAGPAPAPASQQQRRRRVGRWGPMGPLGRWGRCEGRLRRLMEADADALCAWMREALADKLRDVKTTARLVDSPAIITQHESATLRRMMQQVDQAQSGAKVALPRQQLEVNPSHPVMIRLDALRRAGDTDAESRELAQLAAEQIFDYACIGAGLLDDGREMLPRMARLLEFALARDVAVNHHDDAGETAQEAQYSFKPPDEK